MVMNNSGMVNMTDAFLFLTIMLVASIVVAGASQPYQASYTVPDAERALNVLLHSTVPKITLHTSSGVITLKNWTHGDILALYAVQSQEDREASAPAVEGSMISILDSMVMQGWHYDLFLKVTNKRIVLLKVSGGTYESHDSTCAHSTSLNSWFYVQLIIK